MPEANANFRDVRQSAKTFRKLDVSWVDHLYRVHVILKLVVSTFTLHAVRCQPFRESGFTVPSLPRLMQVGS